MDPRQDLLRNESLRRPLPGGANNRVFEVQDGGKRYLLKSYFRHPQDPRDRLKTEFSFGSFAWSRGLRCVAEPIAQDPAEGVALYEFIEGRPARPEEIGADAVAQAADFFLGLNRHRSEAEAQALPKASDACFSVADHFKLVVTRLRSLSLIDEAASPRHREAAAFVSARLAPVWDGISRGAADRLAAAGFDLERPLSGEELCLSPSDFGFHNALLCEGGRFKFFDFEYAGWDDPAKMAADFFSQVAVPVPLEHFGAFVEKVAGGFPDPAALRARIELVLPLHRVKWICLLLNDFLPVAQERRRFSGVGMEERMVEQLKKADRMIKQLEPSSSRP